MNKIYLIIEKFLGDKNWKIISYASINKEFTYKMLKDFNNECKLKKSKYYYELKEIDILENTFKQEYDNFMINKINQEK